MTSFLLFSYLSIFSALIPLIAGLLLWKWTSGKLKFVFWVSLISFLADLISLLLAKYKTNTWPIGNLYIIVQFALLFLVLSDQRKNAFLRFFFKACLGFSALDYFFIQTPLAFNSYTSYATGILMLVVALNYLYNLIDELPSENVRSLPLFWLAFGVLVYYGGTLFLFLFNNYLIIHMPQSQPTIWMLHNSLNITKNIFFFIALWVNYKSKTSPL